MNDAIEPRKPAAILFTDMVGYSAVGSVLPRRRRIAKRFIAGLSAPQSQLESRRYEKGLKHVGMHEMKSL
jgi:hypothetical protein